MGALACTPQRASKTLSLLGLYGCSTCIKGMKSARDARQQALGQVQRVGNADDRQPRPRPRGPLKQVVQHLRACASTSYVLTSSACCTLHFVEMFSDAHAEAISIFSATHKAQTPPHEACCASFKTACIIVFCAKLHLEVQSVAY